MKSKVLVLGSLGIKDSSSEYLFPKRSTDAKTLLPSREFICELSLLKKSVFEGCVAVGMDAEFQQVPHHPLPLSSFKSQLITFLSQSSQDGAKITLDKQYFLFLGVQVVFNLVNQGSATHSLQRFGHSPQMHAFSGTGEHEAVPAPCHNQLPGALAEVELCFSHTAVGQRGTCATTQLSCGEKQQLGPTACPPLTQSESFCTPPQNTVDPFSQQLKS